MQIFFIALVVFLVAIFFMAIGVILRKDKNRGELKGSCGGPEFNPDCCMKKNCDKKNNVKKD